MTRSPLCALISGGLLWLSDGTALAPSHAQVSPDTSLGAESSVVNPIPAGQEITGGALRGEALFHSFEQFSGVQGTRVYFNNAPEIQSIISRVTGDFSSQIDGIIEANGAADLYLIN